MNYCLIFLFGRCNSDGDNDLNSHDDSDNNTNVYNINDKYEAEEIFPNENSDNYKQGYRFIIQPKRDNKNRVKN
jgi:hypothetical protein